MRPIVYAAATLTALHFAGVSIDTVIGACALIFLALGMGTLYMNRDEVARDATRHMFRAARRFERGTRARRFGFRLARKVEAYARKAEREIRAEGII
jgi:hypothetical protein